MADGKFGFQKTMKSMYKNKPTRGDDKKGAAAKKQFASSRDKAASVKRPKPSSGSAPKKEHPKVKGGSEFGPAPIKGPISSKDKKEHAKYTSGEKGTNSHYEAWKKANEGKPRKKREISKKRAPGADAAVQALKDKAAKKRKKGDQIAATHEKRMKNDPKYKADFEEKKKKRGPLIGRKFDKAYSKGPNASKPKPAAAKTSSTTKPKAKAKPTQTSFIKKKNAAAKAKPAASKKRQLKGLKFS